MGAGKSYKERQGQRVSSNDYGKDLARGSLDTYRQTQNGVAKGGPG